MIRTVAVGVDGSLPSEVALSVACDIARASDAELRVLSVVPTATLRQDRSSVRGASPRALQSARERLHRDILISARQATERTGVRKVRARLLHGDPGGALLQELGRAPVDLMLVGARGLSASQRLLLGSVSNALVQGSPSNVLVVQPAAPRRAGPVRATLPRVVVAVDGSAPSEAAFDAAVDLCRVLHLALRVVAAVPSSSSEREQSGELSRLEHVVSSLRDSALEQGVTDVSEEVLRGNPVDALLGYLEKFPPELLAVGSRGMSPARRLLLGSVSTALLHSARVPILVAKRKLPR